MYVLDTNTVIHYFKGMGMVAENLFAKAPADIALPSIVLYELEVGLLKSDQAQKRRGQLDSFVSFLKVLPYGEIEAKASAEIRIMLEAQGLGIGPLDTLIAGTVLSHGGVLVTRNTREFDRVAGLQVENWFD